MYVCMDCYEHFDVRFLKSFDNGFTYICPIDGCHGGIVELDELIAPTIILLNKKGYITKFCCSGHFHKPNSALNTYIYFEDFVELPEKLPYGFELENSNTIRKRYSEFSSEYQTPFDFVLMTNRALYEWAKELIDVEWE